MEHFVLRKKLYLLTVLGVSVAVLCRGDFFIRTHTWTASRSFVFTEQLQH